MKKINSLYIIIGILISVNIISVAMLWRKGRPPLTPDRNMRIEEKLNLAPEQSQKIEILRNDHRNKTEKYRQDLLEERRKLFRMLNSAVTNEDSVKEITGNIGEYHRLLEDEMYWHMLEVRKVLNRDQLKRFNNMMKFQQRRMERQHRRGMP